jgi:hypothetical protein
MLGTYKCACFSEYCAWALAVSRGRSDAYLCHLLERHQGPRLVPRHQLRFQLVGAQEAASRAASHPPRGLAPRALTLRGPTARGLELPQLAPRRKILPGSKTRGLVSRGRRQLEVRGARSSNEVEVSQHTS